MNISLLPLLLRQGLTLLAVGVMVYAMLTGLLAALADPAAAARSTPGMSQSQVKRIILGEARTNGVVPPALALAVAKVESDFRPHVESSAGARGVMQIMPATARSEFGVGRNRLWDPRVNIRLGIRFLEQLYFQYGRRWDLALSHYNGGTLKGRGANARPHGYTRGYVRKVMKWWRHYKRSEMVLALRTAEAEVHATPVQIQSDRMARQAHDYWMLEDPQVDRNWRDYLQVADRWLKDAANGGREVTGQAIAVTGDGLTDDFLRERFRKRLRPTVRHKSGRFQ